MAESTKIEWCDSTFNPWIGCTKVSVGEKGACESCYAEVATPARAMGIQWGPGKPRHRTSPSTWALPARWERNADAFHAEHGRRQRVFCASLADVFDNEVDPQWRVDLFDLIRATPSLEWLLLTKRIGNAKAMLPPDWHNGYQNVRLGSTVVTQSEADRDIPKLLAMPALGHFLSCEPLLEEIDITEWLWGFDEPCAQCPKDIDCECGWNTRKQNGLPSIDQVIVGGESGSKARPMDPVWAESLRYQCADAGTAFFMKQMGGARNKLGDLSDMPESLRVREFPTVGRAHNDSPEAPR
jgi:protein gp37